jgi:iron complex outermembrane receptor protein
LGAVWEPIDAVSIGVDFWAIDKKNVINALNDSLIFGNYAVFGNTNVIRGAVDPAYPNLPGPIETLIEWNQNVGNLRTSGFDVDARWRFPRTDAGRFTATLNGTYIRDWTASVKGLPAVSATGRYDYFLAMAPIPRWRHFASLHWDYGPWDATLSQTFQSGYVDYNYDEGGEPLPNSRRVGTNSTWDAQGSYTGFKNTTVVFCVRNLFDRAPPFSNQRNSFQVGYDPQYGDPLGRTFYTRLTYAFK